MRFCIPRAVDATCAPHLPQWRADLAGARVFSKDASRPHQHAIDATRFDGVERVERTPASHGFCTGRVGNHDDAHSSNTRCIGLRPSWGVVSSSKSMQGLPQWSINTFATPKTFRSWHLSARSNARRSRASRKRGFAPSWSKAIVARGSQFRAARSRGVSAVSIEAADAKKPPTPSAPLTSMSASFEDFRNCEVGLDHRLARLGPGHLLEDREHLFEARRRRRSYFRAALDVQSQQGAVDRARVRPLASGVSDAARTSVVVELLTAATRTASLARSAWAICDGAVTTPQLGSGSVHVLLA